ncbi:MAG: hypothetical protein ACYCW6_17275, partial [Candidatus Xenobia bacterium]
SPAIPHLMIEQFVRYAAWQAQAADVPRRRPTTRRINPTPVFARDAAAGATRPLKLDASMRVAYARRHQT